MWNDELIVNLIPFNFIAGNNNNIDRNTSIRHIHAHRTRTTENRILKKKLDPIDQYEHGMHT